MSWDLQTSGGVNGVSILWRGNWSSASSYNPYDAVYSASNGSSYISKTNNANKDPVSNPSDWDVLAAGSGLRSPRNYLAGMTLSNGADVVNDITVAPGECRDDTNSADIVIPSAITKQLDAAWAAGNNAGGRDTGTIADLTCYTLFAIRNPTTGVCDVLFSASMTPTMPSGYTQKRRIGGLCRDLAGFSGLPPFKQLGDYFQLTTGALQFANVFANGTSGVYLMNDIPRGVKIRGDFRCTGTPPTSGAIVVVDPDTPTMSYPVFQTNVANNTQAGCFQCWTNTSGQLKIWCTTSGGGNVSINLMLLGWTDSRGKDD